MKPLILVFLAILAVATARPPTRRMLCAEQRFADNRDGDTLAERVPSRTRDRDAVHKDFVRDEPEPVRAPRPRPPPRRFVDEGSFEDYGQQPYFSQDRDSVRFVPKSVKTPPQSPPRRKVVDEGSFEDFGLQPNFAQNKAEREGLFSSYDEENVNRAFARLNQKSRVGVRNNNQDVHPRGEGSSETGGQWEEFNPSRQEMREVSKSKNQGH